MERTKNTNKNRLKHGLANVFLFYTFVIFLKSLGSLIIYWRYLCQSGIREISPLELCSREYFRIWNTQTSETRLKAFHGLFSYRKHF